MKDLSGISFEGIPIEDECCGSGIAYAKHSLYESFPNDVATGLIEAYASTTEVDTRKGIEDICEQSFQGAITKDGRRQIIASYRAGEKRKQKKFQRDVTFRDDGVANKKHYIVN